MARGQELCLISLVGMELLRIYVDIGIASIFGAIMLVLIFMHFKEHYTKKKET